LQVRHFGIQPGGLLEVLFGFDKTALRFSLTTVRIKLFKGGRSPAGRLLLDREANGGQSRFTATVLRTIWRQNPTGCRISFRFF
jgi:hypothetical protein